MNASGSPAFDAAGFLPSTRPVFDADDKGGRKTPGHCINIMLRRGGCLQGFASSVVFEKKKVRSTATDGVLRSWVPTNVGGRHMSKPTGLVRDSSLWIERLNPLFWNDDTNHRSRNRAFVTLLHAGYFRLQLLCQCHKRCQKRQQKSASSFRLGTEPYRRNSSVHGIRRDSEMKRALGADGRQFADSTSNLGVVERTVQRYPIIMFSSVFNCPMME